MFAQQPPSREVSTEQLLTEEYYPLLVAARLTAVLIERTRLVKLNDPLIILSSQAPTSTLAISTHIEKTSTTASSTPTTIHRGA
jgi:hypothetical protein